MGEAPKVGNITLFSADKDIFGLGKVSENVLRRLDNCLIGLCPKLFLRWKNAKADGTIADEYAKTTTNVIAARSSPLYELEPERHQRNREEIAVKTIKYLAARESEPSPNAEPVDPDWIFHFAEEAKNITSSDMQEVFARILAGEATKPRSFSKKTVTVVKLLDQQEAVWFSSLCQLTVIADMPIVDIASPFVVNEMGLTFQAIRQLEATGLISAMLVGNLQRRCPFDIGKMPTGLRVPYFTRDILIDTAALKQEKGHFVVDIGQVSFTMQGNELLKVVDRAFRQDVLDYFVATLAHRNSVQVRVENN